jgi:hypothetical protein
MVPRKQAGHMTCTRPQAERQILLAMRASSTHDPIQTPFLTHKMRLCAAKDGSLFREVRYKWASIDHLMLGHP